MNDYPRDPMTYPLGWDGPRTPPHLWRRPGDVFGPINDAAEIARLREQLDAQRALLREWRESLRVRVDAIGTSQAMRNLTLKAEAEAKIAEIDAALGEESKQ